MSDSDADAGGAPNPESPDSPPDANADAPPGATAAGNGTAEAPGPDDRGIDLNRYRFDAGPVELSVVAAGPADGHPVVLLHGFPEFRYGWRAQLPALARAGHRVYAPDGRGYARSDRPDGVRAYHVRELAADAARLLERGAAAAGRESASLVGHDWGGLVAWWVALSRPALLDRLAVLNCPHPAVLRRHLYTDPRQLLRNWYGGLFQVPRLPERLLRARGFAALRYALRGHARPGTFDDADIARYRAAWARPGALTGMLNWYRALARYRPRPPGRAVSVPTLLVWGRHDGALRRVTATESLAHCRDCRLLDLDATHWVHHERPDRVNGALLGHLD